MTINFELSPWPIRTVAAVTEVLDRMRRPINASERAFRQGIYPYFGANGQVGTIDNYIFDEELVLVAEDGGFFFDPLKPIAYRVSGKSWVNNHAHVLRANQDMDPDWLYLSLAFQDVSTYVKGATRPKLNQAELRELPVPCPPIDEQRRIVARIKACMERIDEIEGLRQETTRISTALLPAHLNDISLASVWPEAPLAEVLDDTRNGRSIRADGEIGNGAVLTLSAVRSVMLDQSAFKAVTMDDDTARRFQVRAGDIFVSRANTYELVGLSGYVDATPNPRTIFPDLLIRLTPKADQLDAKYLAYALRFPKVRKQIQERASGSSQSMVKISGERLREVRIPVPPLYVQKGVAAELDVVRDAFKGIGENLIQPEVGNLRSAVLRKAFAGEL